MHVIVLGAGVAGLTAAWCLAGDGHAVTVIDREAGPGRGASYANGGQLSYSYVAPLAAPSALLDLPRWLVQRDAPMRFRPQLDPQQWAWCLRFLAACTAGQNRRGAERLLTLSFYSRRLVDELVAETALAFDHNCAGKLVVYSSADSYAAALRQRDFQARFGCQQQAATVADCLEIEPALASLRDRLVGGIFTPSDQAGDCAAFCAALETRLRRTAPPVRFLYGHTVTRLIADGGRLQGVETDHGLVTGDGYVLALGVGAARLARGVGLSLPIYPLKGYSLTAPITDPRAAPSVSVTDYARKIVYARLGDRLRAAGMADVVGEDTAIAGDRMALLLREARATFPAAADYQQVECWSGLRPATPTGLPILGGCRLENLWLDVGLGALGFTLAMGAARVVADLIAGRRPVISLDALSLSG
jgi:D-amino-acid dehydrogenase